MVFFVLLVVFDVHIASWIYSLMSSLVWGNSQLLYLHILLLLQSLLFSGTTVTSVRPFHPVSYAHTLIAIFSNLFFNSVKFFLNLLPVHWFFSPVLLNLLVNPIIKFLILFTVFLTSRVFIWVFLPTFYFKKFSKFENLNKRTINTCILSIWIYQLNTFCHICFISI